MARWKHVFCVLMYYWIWSGNSKKGHLLPQNELHFDFLPGKKTVKIVLPGNTGYSCILGSGKQIALPDK